MPTDSTTPDVSDAPPAAQEPFDADKSLEFLRANGVEVELAEERAAKKQVAARAAASSESESFTFVKIPAEATVAVSIEEGKYLLGGGDVLSSLLAPRFADEASLDDDVVARETADRLKGMFVGAGGNENFKAPTAASVQLQAQGGVCEAWPLSRPSETNDYRKVSLYIDEIGALRARPRNARAEALALACGLAGVAIHGDAYVGRCGRAPAGGERNESFGLAELEHSSPWVVTARQTHGQQALEQNFGDDEHLKSGGDAEADGYTWTQTEDDVEVRVCKGVPSEKGSKKRIKVSYGKGASLTVHVDGTPVLELATLFDRVAPDECSWSLDGGTLVVQMEKVEPRAWAHLTLRKE